MLRNPNPKTKNNSVTHHLSQSVFIHANPQPILPSITHGEAKFNTCSPHCRSPCSLPAVVVLSPF
jgi:hypothetical protein